jgi:hypothetical protein
VEPIVGIFASRSAADNAARLLRGRGFAEDQISMLLPGEPPPAVEAEVPTEEAEQSGVGQAIGGVVGGAAGASAGMLVASLLVPGVGAVTAIGIAAAALLGAAGAVGGVKAGGALEKTRHGIPKDELYLYEDALMHGKSLVFAHPETDPQVSTAHKTLQDAGAESLESARDAWWVGIRDAEKAHYDALEGDFESSEEVYRQGLLAGLQPDFRGKTFENARPQLRSRFGDAVDHTAFRTGFVRGAERARDREAVLEPASRVS